MSRPCRPRRARTKPASRTEPLGTSHGRIQPAGELTLQGHPGQAAPSTCRGDEGEDLPHLPLRPGVGREATYRHLSGRYGQVRPDGSRRAAEDQERSGQLAHLPPLLPRRYLRQLRHEHRRHQYARLHQGPRHHRRRSAYLPAAAHAGGEGLGARPHQLLRAVRGCEALAADAHAASAGWRAPAEQGRPGEGGQALRLHSLRLLLHQLPQLLVEQRPLSRARGAARGLPLDCRFARRGNRRALGRTRRPVPSLPLPHHHELHRGLSEGLEPRARHW